MAASFSLLQQSSEIEIGSDSMKATASVLEAAAEVRPLAPILLQNLLIPPTLQIRAGWCALHDSFDDLWRVELMVAES